MIGPAGSRKKHHHWVCPVAAPRPESSVTLSQTRVSVWAPARLSYVCGTGEPGSECFLCLPELRPIILEAGGTLGLLSWARVLDFQNSYIQQILKSSPKPCMVAGTGNAEDSRSWPYVASETNLITMQYRHVGEEGQELSV